MSKIVPKKEKKEERGERKEEKVKIEENRVWKPCIPKRQYTNVKKPEITKPKDESKDGLQSLIEENKRLAIVIRDYNLKDENYDHKRKACESELKRKIGVLEGDVEVQRKKFKECESDSLVLSMENCKKGILISTLQEEVQSLRETVCERNSTIQRLEEELRKQKELNNQCLNALAGIRKTVMSNQKVFKLTFWESNCN